MSLDAVTGVAWEIDEVGDELGVRRLDFRVK